MRRAGVALTGLMCLALAAGFASGSAAAETACGCAELGLAPDPLNYVTPSRNYRTLHTTLDLDIDLERQTLAGSVTHRLECLRSGDLLLNCVGLDIDRVELDGRRVSWQYPVAGRQETSWFQYQGAGESANLLRIIPAADQALQRGQQLTLQVWYSGAPKTGLHFQRPEPGSASARYEVWSQGQGENNRFWFPCFDYPSDKATYEGKFRVAKPYSVLSNGLLVGTRDLGSQQEFHWRLDQPQASYLMMVAAGEYEVYRDEWRGREVSYWVPPGTTEAVARRSFGQTVDMLDFFSDVTGTEYPYDKYAQVVVQNFIYGGMENTTATVLVNSALLSDGAALTRDSQGLVAHELAHMWWGDMLTCREWTQMWLNEGFATYFQKMYRQHANGDSAFIYEMDDAHAKVLAADAKDPRPVVVDFFNRRDERSNSNIYEKGASVLDMLRAYVGDDVFRDAIARYGRDNQWRTVETADLMRAFRDASGENLDWFFEQWIYLSGHPDLRVTKQWDEARKLLTLTVEQTQKVTDQVPLFRLPLRLEFDCAGQRLPYDVLVEGARQDFYFSLPSEPNMVLFDKGGHTLKTLDFKRPQRELQYQLFQADDWGRIEAARALGDLGANEEAAQALGAVLIDEQAFWGLRKECASALARNNTALAQQILIDGLASQDARTRLAVTEQAGRPPCAPPLEEALVRLFATDPADAVRAAALTRLVRLKSDRAYKLCLQALTIDSDKDLVRIAGIEGLASFGKPEDARELRALAAAGNARLHRHVAFEQFAKLARLDADPAQRQAAASFLAEQLSDWYPNTRSAAITQLVSLGEKSAVEDLRRAAATDPVERIRRQANQAALDLEAQQSPQPDWDAMNGTLKALQDEVSRLKDAVVELEKRNPQSSKQ